MSKSIFLLGAGLIIAVPLAIPAFSQRPSTPTPTAFLHEKPWPDKELGSETFAVIIGLINETRYHCPRLNRAKAAGTGTLGNVIYAYCTTGDFEINYKPDTDRYSVGPLHWGRH